MISSILIVLFGSLCAVCLDSIVFNGKDSRVVIDLVFGHLLIGFETVSSQYLVNLFDSDKFIRIDFLFVLIPEH